VDFQLAVMIKCLGTQRATVPPVLVDHRMRRDVMLESFAAAERLAAHEAKIRTIVAFVFLSAGFHASDTTLMFQLHVVWLGILKRFFFTLLF